MLKEYFNQAIFGMHLVKYRLRKTAVPLFTALGVTNRCNYNCVYCYGDYYHQKKQEYFSTEELLEIIDKLGKMGTHILNLIGGEPLLRDDVGLLIERVKRNKMICAVSTNGSLVPEKINHLRRVDYIDTSLDGLKENNDKNRGQGTFQQTLEGIQCAVKNRIKTNVNMVLTKYNLTDIDAMIKLAVDTGFTLSFNIVFESHSYDHKNYQDSMDIKNKDDLLMKNALQKLIGYKRRGYPIRFLEAAYQYALNWPCSYGGNVYVTDKTLLRDFKPIKCYYSQFHCYIDTDGRMYNCQHLKDITPVINVKAVGVEKAWEKISSLTPPCLACYTICNNNANLIFSLKPSILISAMRDIISKHI